MANPIDVVLHEFGAESSSGAGAAVDIDALRRSARLELVVASLGAGASLAVEVQSSDDGATWSWAGEFVPVSSSGTQKLAFGPLRRYVRASWTVSGSATFSVKGEAHVTYADLSDYASQGVSGSALATVADTVKVDSLINATADVDAALATRYSLPLLAWGEDIRQRVVMRATYYCFKHRGINPESGADQLVLLDGGLMTGDGRPTGVESWLQKVASGRVHPVGIVDSTPSKSEFGARVRSVERREY